MRMTGAEAAVAALEAQGICTIFGIPGGHSVPLYDALARHRRIRHVLGRHEQGLAFMADGYSRASGEIGVVTTTSGPGVANLAGALGGATTDTSAVLVISSAVRSDFIGRNRGVLHDLNQTLDLMRAVCGPVCRCSAVEQIPGAIRDLVFELRCRRPRAAYCEIPADILRAEGDVEVPPAVRRERVQPDPQATRRAVRLLTEARRPVIWTGTGAVWSDAAEDVDALARALGAIVVMSSLGRGLLPADHPHVVLREGLCANAVDDLIGQADVVLAVGTMFKGEDTNNWTLKPGEKLIHIDIDPEEIGRSYPAEVGIVADARAALAAIRRGLPKRQPADPAWVRKGKEAQDAFLERRRRQGPTEMRAVDILRSRVPRDAILVFDRCNLGYWAWVAMPTYAPRTFHYPMGYGGLGGALPQAIGAKLACLDRTVLCVIGDGGFQFTATELAVAVQEKTPFTIVLCNNGKYGAIEANMRKNYGHADLGCELMNPDFLKFASAYGVPAVRVDTLDGFAAALERGLKADDLNLIELTVDLCDPPW